MDARLQHALLDHRGIYSTLSSSLITGIWVSTMTLLTHVYLAPPPTDSLASRRIGITITELCSTSVKYHILWALLLKETHMCVSAGT
jgi:hypothetical protein